MPHYLVFAIDERTTSTRDTAGGLETFAAALAVFRAESPELACQAAATKTRRLATYFAIEGTPWGLGMNNLPGTYELGADPSLPQLAAGDRNDRDYESVTAALDHLEQQ